MSFCRSSVRPPLTPHARNDRFCAFDRGQPPSSVGLDIDRAATSPPPSHRDVASAIAPGLRLRQHTATSPFAAAVRGRALDSPPNRRARPTRSPLPRHAVARRRTRSPPPRLPSARIDAFTRCRTSFSHLLGPTSSLLQDPRCRSLPSQVFFLHPSLAAPLVIPHAFQVIRMGCKGKLSGFSH
jgi:hypothetical protein